ncbi:MAG: class I adenylate cyclase [Deltaproteobacteria bacterium]|nr:class I adenylate cyclase [Deltaproteobacteria bacterium]
MLSTKALQKNKKIYLEYNNFRKQIFSELAPKDSEAILYLLPCLLSINNPSFPGFVKNLKQNFKVFNIEANKEIMKRQQAFKKMFDYKSEGSLLKFSSRVLWIQGIYTIGSVGTISQTSRSDCDLWICIDKQEFSDESLEQLQQKINLIKGWMDANLKIPVNFFISDVEDIRSCNFGNVDYESSGSAQRNVLKEEFYRTSIMIGGKIPFWWMCFDENEPVEYEKAVTEYSRGSTGEYDFIDLGNLEAVDREEYFGAALWQFNKSLTHPLKSIIKMLLLKMLLESPKEELPCHRFRSEVLGHERDADFSDPSMFTMRAILDYYRDIDNEAYEFIKRCFYLRYDVKLLSKKLTLKETLAADLFKQYKLEREDIYHLNNFAAWDFHEQTGFGDRIFSLLLQIYKDITAIQQGTAGEIAPQDLTIIGRKLSACLVKKNNKIAILHKPIDNLNLPPLSIRFQSGIWQVSTTQETSAVIVSNADIIHCIAYLVWNDIYHPGQIRMVPNTTPVTLQEIINLAKKIREVFGVYDIARIEFENFLSEEKYLKLLVVISFEGSHYSKDINDFCLIYRNNWGELFVTRLNSSDKLKTFLSERRSRMDHMEVNYYIQRSSMNYEKMIERTKSIITEIL